MQVEINSEDIEEYAVKVAKAQLREQVKTLIAGEMEGLNNFSKLRSDVWSLQREVRRLSERLAKLEKRRWWKRERL